MCFDMFEAKKTLEKKSGFLNFILFFVSIAEITHSYTHILLLPHHQRERILLLIYEMPYLKPNVPYEDNRTREEVLEYAFSALKRNHDAFSSSSSLRGKSSSSLSFVK